jgi:MoxR-like ATPase
LHEHLSLRELRCSGQLSENDAQRYGGLGGIIVEGEPGAGKSRLVEAALKSRGYQQRLWNNTDVIEGGDYYYKMPASMPVDEKKALLLRAFHEGAVVFCDEINSGSTLLMEDFLNDLLTGKTPDEKKPPHKPGFTIFGTQNPVIMGGNRIEASTALLRRCQQVILPGYPSEEIASILSHQFGQEHRELIETIVYAFETATKNSKIKPPTFRHLLKLIKAEISLTVSANDGMEVSVQSDLPNAHGFFSETSAPKSSARTWSMRDDEPVDEPQQRPRCS